MSASSPPSVFLIIESGTDVRLLEGLADRVTLRVLVRRIAGGREVNRPTRVPVLVGDAGRLRFAWRVFRDVLHAGPRDVVLVQGYGAAALAANLASRLRSRACWMLVCSPLAEYYSARRTAGAPFSGLMLLAIRTLARLNGFLGRGYIVLSEYLRSVVLNDGPGKPVRTIPVYGVDVNHFAPSCDRSSARARRRLPPDGHIIFTSSRVAPEKDSQTLIAAFSLLAQQGRNVYLLHRSGGYRQFVQQAARAGVADRVIATDAADPRGDLPLDYIASDVCVQASRAEGLGFSMLESLACGTPAVASAVGGLVETVRHGITGWSVPAGDPVALAGALGDALDSPEEARRRAAAGAAMVRERFDSRLVFAQLVDALSEPLSR